MRRGLALVFGFGLATACAHTPVPSQQLAAAQANVARAEQMGANDNPDAAYHLRLARQQLDQGKKLIDKKDNLEASYVLRRAEADGQLAVAVAEYGTASTEAEQSRARVEQLRERNNNNAIDSTTGVNSSTQSTDMTTNGTTNYQTR